MSSIRFQRAALAVVTAALVAPLHAYAANANPAEPQAAPSAQPSAVRATGSRTSLSADDRRFAINAAEAGMGEVEAGKLAEQKAESAQVKQFGARMVRDHSQANDRLRQIAASKNLELPTRLDKHDQKTLDELTKLSGAQFDPAYIKKQVAGHKQVIAQFRKEAKSGKDADLRAFASNTLPTLEEHLNLAQSASKAIRDEASKSASNSSAKAARKATGASYATAEKQEHMPVPKTGM